MMKPSGDLSSLFMLSLALDQRPPPGQSDYFFAFDSLGLTLKWVPTNTRNQESESTHSSRWLPSPKVAGLEEDLSQSVMSGTPSGAVSLGL